MSARGEGTPLPDAMVSIPKQPGDNVTIGDLRGHLVELLALAETSEKPRPTRVHPAEHAMPGQEWAVEAHMPKVVYDHFYRRERDGWLIRATDAVDDADCIFISTPDAMDAEDFMAVPTTSARQLAMAILAACDRADAVRTGTTSLDSWRAKKARSIQGDQVT
nr:hypothetical protein [Streptomyces sp. W9]